MGQISDIVLLRGLDYQYNSAIIDLIVFFLILIIVISIFTPSKSKKARETFSDLYVIGMIRKFAKEDEINLDDEFKQLRKIGKLQRVSKQSLDKKIEQELKEKIQAKSEKKIEELQNKK